MQRLQFLAAQPWFDPSTEQWPCGGDELFVGLVTFELAGDALHRRAEAREVLLDFEAPLLASRTQSQFRLALRKARPEVGGKRSSSAALDNRPCGHLKEGLFAHVATAGDALHGILLHTQITRMTDNVQDRRALPPTPFLRLEFGGVALVQYAGREQRPHSQASVGSPPPERLIGRGGLRWTDAWGGPGRHLALVEACALQWGEAAQPPCRG